MHESGSDVKGKNRGKIARKRTTREGERDRERERERSTRNNASVIHDTNHIVHYIKHRLLFFHPMERKRNFLFVCLFCKAINSIALITVTA